MKIKLIFFCIIFSCLFVACASRKQVEKPAATATAIPTSEPVIITPANETISTVQADNPVTAPTEIVATETAVPAQPTATPEVADNTITMLTEDGEEVQITLPPPDGIQLLLANIAAGQYALPEAVIAALQQYSGEEPIVDLFTNQGAFKLDGWRLSSLAVAAYANATPTEQTEIERLYNKIIPSPEILETISIPADQSGLQQKTQLAKPQAQTDCLALWASGFPEEERTLCLQYLEFTQFGHTYRIYYPESRRADEAFLAYVQAASEALHDSVQTYGELTDLQDINLIFTALPSSEVADDTAAFVPGLTPGEIHRAPCPILVLPHDRAGTPDDRFKQVIAHEVFHCVQYWRQDRSTDESATWYIEGMAEYFGGVVYPNANIEHEYLGGFNFFTASESILNLEYSSWVFFQYLGNRFGKEFVIQMLDALPTSGGTTAQAAALASIGDMPHVFHEFGQAFLDGQLQDENGSPLPMRPYYLPPNRFLLTPGSRQLQAHPFQLARYRLTYEETKEYLINLEPTGSAGLLTARNATTPGGWGDLPLEIRTGCDPVTYVGLVTNTDASSDYRATAQTEWLDEYMCDRCLIGTWMQDTDVIDANFRTLAVGANIVAVRGQFFLMIDDRTMIFSPQDYGVQVDNEGEVMDFAIEGSSTSTYVIPAENEILAVQGPFEFTTTFTSATGSYTTVLGPEAVGMIPSPFSFGPTDPLDPDAAPSPDELGGGTSSTETTLPFTYTCTEDTLTTYPPPGLSPITSSTYTRVSGTSP